ncbi:hypothetical protein PS005_23945, partial [Shigella sonnei]|nr:hypothetical protein [Shigella sonnei]
GEKVKENDYLKNSKITVSLFKNKIKIDIKGEIIPRVEVAQKAQVLEQEIIEGLKSFFGLEHTKPSMADFFKVKSPLFEVSCTSI